jgi:hypothetical protein
MATILKRYSFVFAMVCVILFIYPFVHNLSKHLHKIYYGDVLILTVFCSFCFLPSFRRKLFTVEGISLLIYLCILRLSIWHISFRGIRYGSDLSVYPMVIQYILAAFLVYLGMILKVRDNRSFLKSILLIIFFYGVIQAILAILQYFLQHTLNLQYFGESSCVNYNTFRIDIPHGHIWIIDKWLHITRDTVFFFRSSGLMDNPNILGGVLCFTLFISYMVYLIISFSWIRCLVALGIFLQIFSLFITYSRAALAAWFIASCFWFIYIYVVKKRICKSLLLLIVSSFVICLGLFYEQMEAKGGVKGYTIISKERDGDRIDLQDFSFLQIKQHPFIGVGYKNYVDAAHKYFSNYPSINPVHNIYLLMWVELGLAGLIAFLTFIISMLYRALSRYDDPMVVTLISIIGALVFIGLFDHYLYSYMAGVIIFFSAFGLLAFVLSIKRGIIKS